MTPAHSSRIPSGNEVSTLSPHTHPTRYSTHSNFSSPTHTSNHSSLPILAPLSPLQPLPLAARQNRAAEKFRSRLGSRRRGPGGSRGQADDVAVSFAFWRNEGTFGLKSRKVLRKVKFPLFVCLATWLAAVSTLLHYEEELPDPTTAAFGIEWPKDSLVVTTVSLLTLFNVLLVLPAVAWKLVCCWSCVRNKNYWLATPDRERDAVVFLVRLSIWIAIVFNVFALVGVAVTIAANLRTDPSPTSMDILVICIDIIFAIGALALLLQQMLVRFSTEYVPVPSHD